jgi:hypothetical protein
MKHPLILLLALAVVLAVAPATRADLVTFDDLPGNVGIIPNGYAGYNWSSFAYVNGTLKAVAHSGLPNAVVSPPIVAVSRLVGTATISATTPFAINSGDFTSVKRDGMTITAVGTLNGATVFDTSFTVNTSGPTVESFGGATVDTVTFTASGGTLHPDFRRNTNRFALDNLDVTPGSGSAAQAPEPTSLTLFGLAALCTGVYAWRRRRAAA